MNFKELKSKAREVIKKNVWTLLFVGILMSSVFREYTITKSSNENLEALNKCIEAFQNGEEMSLVEEDENGNKELNKYVDEVINESLYGSKDGEVKDINEKFGVTHGVFYAFFGFITRGKIQLKNFVNSFIDFESKLRATRILIIIASSFGLIVKILFINPVFIGENRIFMESRNYNETKINRIAFCFTKKRYFKTIKSVFKYDLYKGLWDITIIGGFIKAYSYYMVKFIIAENPEISGKDAIKISREMMNGHKWETFILDLSFFWWHVLQVATFGIAGFWVNTYIKATGVELYSELRENYIKEKKYGYELLNDIVLYNNEGYTKYPDDSLRRRKINYKYNYRPSSIILFFFTFAFVGWIWEVLLYLFRDGILVNRGTTYGPWLPVYGLSCTAIILLVTRFDIFKKLMKNTLAMFLFIMIFATTMEYIGSWFTETFLGLKYWDYTGVFMNINGRVCLECSLFFGVGGSLCLYIVAPFLERQFEKLTLKVRISACLILVALFGIDEAYSFKHPNQGEGITSSVEVSSINEENKLLFT